MVKVRASPQPTRRRTNPPRPPNAWILFRQSVAAEVKRDLAITYQPHVTQIASPRWHALSMDEKAFWQSRAKDAERAHALKYPNYQFKPETLVVEKKKRRIANQRERKELNTAIGLKMARQMDVSPELEALKGLQMDKKRGCMPSLSNARGSKTSMPAILYSAIPVPSTVSLHTVVSDIDASVTSQQPLVATYQDTPPLGSQLLPMTTTTQMGVDHFMRYQTPAPISVELDNCFNMSLLGFWPALLHDDGSQRESDMIPLAEWSQWSA